MPTNNPAPILTLFEQASAAYAWTEAERAKLARLSRAAGAGPGELLRAAGAAEARRLEAGRYVGGVRLGARRVQVLPRLADDAGPDGPEGERQAAARLLGLLRLAGRLPLSEAAVGPLLRREADWLERLAHVFAHELAEMWQRGPRRGYVSVEAELPVLRGQWRHASQARRPERPHLFHVTYDEFSADTPLNRVFRYVVERLWRLTRDAGNRRRLGELRQWLDEVTLLPRLRAGQVTPALLTRLDAPQRPLLNLARLLVEGGALQTAGEAYALMFDMREVFAEAVGRLVKEAGADSPLTAGPLARVHNGREGVTESPLTPGPRPTGAMSPRRGERRFSAEVEANTDLKPHVVVRDARGEVVWVGRFEYRWLEGEERAARVARGEGERMKALARRYGCGQAVVIYPQPRGAGPLRARLDLGEGVWLAAGTIEVRRDWWQAAAQEAGRQEVRRVMGGG